MSDLSGAVLAASTPLLADAVDGHVAVSVSPLVGRNESTSDGGWSRIAPVLATLATGIGVAGFVTFVGGLIVYTRLDAAGAPAATAVSIIPSQDLLVIGAATLVGPLLFGAVAVIVLVIVGSFLREFSASLSQESAGVLAGNAGLLTGFVLFLFTAVTMVLRN